MEENQAVLTEYINELKNIVSEMSAESALAKAKHTVQTKISSEAISKQKEIITGLAAKVSSLEKEQPAADDFTYGDEHPKEQVVEEQPVDDFTYGDEQPEEQVIEEQPEENNSSIEVDLLRQLKQLQSSSAEQEDYISRLEAGIEEGNKVIADAEGSRDKALERLRELEESQQAALKKANTLEASQQAALKKAKELEEKLKHRPATAPTSNVVSMKSKKLEEDMSKMEKTNLKLLKDLTAAENKIKELKDKAAKGKI
jgi:chromosome segregation ATPase